MVVQVAVLHLFKVLFVGCPGCCFPVVQFTVFQFFKLPCTGCPGCCYMIIQVAIYGCTSCYVRLSRLLFSGCLPDSIFEVSGITGHDF